MRRENEVQHVFLVGAKSLGAYGGYETFVYKLTEHHQDKKNIKYHVACKANGDGCMDETKVEGVTRINDYEFELHNAHCFKIDIPQIGAAQAIYYDVAALKACCKYIKEHGIKHPIIYIMACRIGPFAGHFYNEIHKLGGTVYLNPDGHEWMRTKWSAPIRKYWKISEQMMVKYCDLAICDSVNIEKYIHKCYDGKGIKGRNPKTRSQQQLNPVHLPWHNLKIIKIKLMTRPRHTRRMLRNPQNLQSLLGSCLRHLPQRTISMPTGHSMRMQIQHRIISHNKPLLISYNIPLHYTTILLPPQANFPSTHFYHPFLLKQPSPQKIASSQRRKIVCLMCICRYLRYS